MEKIWRALLEMADKYCVLFTADVKMTSIDKRKCQQEVDVAGEKLKDAFKDYSDSHCCLSGPCFYHPKCDRRYGKYFLLGIFFVPCAVDLFYADSWFSHWLVFAQLFGLSSGQKIYGRN